MLVDLDVVDAELRALAKELGYPASLWLSVGLERIKQRVLGRPAVLDFQLRRRRRRDGANETGHRQGTDPTG